MASSSGVSEFTVIIPARYASSRLPGKPLLPIGDKPMILHAMARAEESGATSVIVATDDERIASVVRGAGGDACMTRADHESGTDRLEEVCSVRGLADDAIVVNLQGDEPLMPPAVIDMLVGQLVEANTPMATVAEPIVEARDAFDPNIVKVVCARDGTALYFSRASIPFARDDFADGPPERLPIGLPVRRHLGIYAYRARVLRDFVGWDVEPLEAAEKLEQLRALAHGVRILVVDAPCAIPGGVDTEDDLTRVRAVLGDGPG